MDIIKPLPGLFDKPQRDAQGRFIKGNTMTPIDKVGAPCHFCRDSEKIMNKIALFSLWTRGKVDKKLHMPYIQDLCDEDYLDVPYETFHEWLDLKNEHNKQFHTELAQTIRKLHFRKESMLLKRTLGDKTPIGAIFQLKANHGYMETEKRILQGDAEKPVHQKLEIEITEANKHD